LRSNPVRGGKSGTSRRNVDQEIGWGGGNGKIADRRSSMDNRGVKKGGTGFRHKEGDRN